MKHNLRATLVAAGLTLALAACGGGGDNGGSSDEGLPDGDIVIGAAIAKTGLLAPFDEGIKAIKLQIEDINKAGGVEGHQVKLIEADTRSDLQRGSAAAQELIDQGAQIMLVACDVASGAPAALVAADNGLLVFTLCSSEAGWNPPNFDGLAFSTFGSIPSEGAAGAQYLHDEQGVNKTFLLVDTTVPYGEAQCKAYEGWVTNQGGSIAGTAEFRNDDASISGQVAQVRSSGADGIAVCSFPPGGASALKQLRAAGVDLPAWGPQSFDGTFWLESVPDLSNFYVTTPGSVFGDDPRPEVNRVVGDLLDRGAQDTSAIAGYSVFQAIVKAIEATQSVDGETLTKELETFKDEPLLIGPTTYTDEFHVPNRPEAWYVLQVQGGKDTFAAKIEPDFVPTITD